jgi:TPR repeat protein
MFKIFLYRCVCYSATLSIAISLCVFCLTGCSKEKAEKTPGQSFYLSQDDIKQLSLQGEKGDGTAAFRLFQYYELYLEDGKQSFYWLKKAAENGHVIAQYNLGLEFLNNQQRKDRTQALYWLRKAAQSGNADAKEIIQKLEKQE